MEGVQRKAIRFCFNKYKLTDSLTELLKRAGLLTLQSRAKLARLKFSFQFIHGDINIDVSPKLSLSISLSLTLDVCMLAAHAR